MLRTRNLLLAAGILAVSCATSLGAARASGPPLTALAEAPDLSYVVRGLTPGPGVGQLPPLPGDPLEALVTAVNAQSASLGFPVDHGPAIRAAGLPPEFAGRLALLMQAVLACGAATTGLERVGCASTTSAAAADLSRTPAPLFRDVSAWPSLYIDGNASSDAYVNDYSVLIDRGGSDRYDNNAGGNLQDVRYGPPGSAAPKIGPAIGCEQVTGNFPAPTLGGQDCIAAPQVVLIDMKNGTQSSNDVYGAFKWPRAVDNNPPSTGPRHVDGDCTRSPLVRRMVLEGSGFEGNGLLIDTGGNDRYYGKTAAQGSGHVGGVGVLWDLGGGNDTYVAIRNSQGFSLIGAVGLLRDDGGDDRYGTYMPTPRRYGAKYQEYGSGGVIDDTGLCDNLPRMVQGAALLGGTGYLLDEGGRDIYQGAPPATQPFLPGVLFDHSSQGFGCDSGQGVLEDRGPGHDIYLNGPAGRVDGASLVEPDTQCFATPGLGVFSDAGP